MMGSSAYLSIRTWTQCFTPAVPKKKESSITIQLQKTNYQLSATSRAVFNNSLLFDKILTYLDTPALLQAREVCTSWNYEICRILQTKRFLKKTCQPPLLKFESYGNFQDLLKHAKKVATWSEIYEESYSFFLDKFYFKMPRFQCIMGKTFLSLPIQNLITKLKITVYYADLEVFLNHILHLSNLKELHLLQLPESCLGSSYPLGIHKGASALSSFMTPSLPLLESCIFQNLINTQNVCYCASITCTTTLVNFLKRAPHLKLLETLGWPGRVVQIVELSKIYGSLEVLKIKGKRLGDDQMKRLGRLKFLNLKWVDLSLHSNVSKGTVEEFLKLLKLTGVGFKIE